MNESLPEGLEITACTVGTDKTPDPPDMVQRYHVELKDGFFDQNDLESFLRQRTVNIERKNKKGKKNILDLKRAVAELRILDARHARMSLGRDNNLLVRPAQVLKTIFHLSEQQILTAMITKQKNDHV